MTNDTPFGFGDRGWLSPSVGDEPPRPEELISTETETVERDDGTEVEVSANGRWTVDPERDDMAGDVLDDDIHLDVHGEHVRLVQLPTGPVDERDPGIIPACAWCNHENNLAERLFANMEAAIEQHDDPRDLDETDMIVRADYAVLGLISGRILAFACHTCVQT